MRWLYAEFTKLSTAIIFLTQLLVHWEEICEKVDKFLGIKTWIERQLNDRRKNHMHVIESFLQFIEHLFDKHAPEIVAAATSPEARAIEEAAASAAIASASQDPKVAAGIAVYQAVRNYNEATKAPAAQ